MINRSQTIRDQVIRLMMWGWIWPLFFIEGLFAFFFVIAFQPYFLKLVVAGTLISVEMYLAYNIRYRWQLARLWFLHYLMGGFNLIFFTLGIAVLWGFRLRLPEDSLKLIAILFGLVAVGALTKRYYIPGLQPLLEADTRTGRFDLEKGTYSLRVLPNFYESKIPLLNKPFQVGLIAFIAIEVTAQFLHKDIWGGMLFLIITALCVGGLVGIFHTYRFIRRWEKQTGRTMWIEGFEPGASAHEPSPRAK